MKFLLVAVVLMASLESILSATCTYDQSANQINCSGVVCSTIAQVQGGKLPRGKYRIGTFYHNYDGRVPWFNLYPPRSRGGFWDYYTRAPELGLLGCRGGFGLHPGITSKGCITVTNTGCFNRIKDVIQRFPMRSFTVTECKRCVARVCTRGTGTLTRDYLTDLQVVQ